MPHISASIITDKMAAVRLLHVWEQRDLILWKHDLQKINEQCASELSNFSYSISFNICDDTSHTVRSWKILWKLKVEAEEAVKAKKKELVKLSIEKEMLLKISES